MFVSKQSGIIWFPNRSLDILYRIWTPKNTGIIGALLGEANDTNGNGFIDIMVECFEFAKISTEQYTDQKMNPVAYNDLGDLPFVKLPEQLKADFAANPTAPRVNETVTFNASTSEGTILNYTWDFGDDNTTTVSTPTINHTYSSVGNYTVTLNVTNNGLWDTTSIDVTVTYRTDLDRDGIVNIVDIAKVAVDYGKTT